MIETRLERPTKNQTTREHIISELKSDLRYTLFYLLPTLRPATSDWRDLAHEMRLPLELAEDFAAQLFSAELWRRENDMIVVGKDHLDLGDLKISEFLSMSMSLIARMHEDGPCWYETLFVVTCESLKKEFYRKVNVALKELIVSSAEAPKKDTILAWNHAGLDCLKSVGESKQ
ncbi:MAG TPA: hypothetical protein PKC28_16210 [Bdellovibrionales bacterium]|nr:hypothetical protein [Bdellovibrionales bacterium]